MEHTANSFEFPHDGTLFLSLPKQHVPEMVAEYVSLLETQRTNDWCKCEWIVHPDDVNLDIHNCRQCHHPRALHTMEGCTKVVMGQWVAAELGISDECQCAEWADPPKRRMRRGGTNIECPVHTKEGFLLGFFEWVFKDADTDD